MCERVHFLFVLVLEEVVVSFVLLRLFHLVSTYKVVEIHTKWSRLPARGLASFLLPDPTYLQRRKKFPFLLGKMG